MRRPTRVLLYRRSRPRPQPSYHITSPNQIDVSKQLVRWVQQEHYALLDINLFPKPPPSNKDVSPRPTSFPVTTFCPTVSAKIFGAVYTRSYDISLGQLHFVRTVSTRVVGVLAFPLTCCLQAVHGQTHHPHWPRPRCGRYFRATRVSQ